MPARRPDANEHYAPLHHRQREPLPATSHYRHRRRRIARDDRPPELFLRELPQLLGTREELVVTVLGPVVVAVVGLVLPADLGPRLVDAAAVVGLEVLA